MGRNDESQHGNSLIGHVQCYIRTITNLTVIWATTTNRVNIQGSHKVFTMGVGKGDNHATSGTNGAILSLFFFNFPSANQLPYWLLFIIAVGV